MAEEDLGPASAFSIASLGTIASSMSYLDKRGQVGFSYSLPPNMKSKCDYVRPYHFWMTAYLGHKMKNKYSAESIMKASHIMVTAYERFAPVRTNSNKPLLKPEIDAAVYDTETQKDIVFHDMGMAFGLNPESDKTQNLIDDSLLRVFNSAKKARNNPPGLFIGGVNDVLKAMVAKSGEGRVYKSESFLGWHYRNGADAHMEGLYSNLEE